MRVLRTHPSISLPIALGSVAVVLTIFLLVGWTLVGVQNMAFTRRVVEHTWLLVAGLVSFGVVLSVMVLFSVFLVQQILEVRRQTTFIDSVTHELKSPLASLKLCLETMARSEISAPQRQQLRQMMLGDVDRLTIFIDDILEASRLTHGRRSYTLCEVYLLDTTKRCVEALKRRYQLPAEAITLHIEDDLHLLTDPTALETILANLLDNSIKYSVDPVRVEIDATRHAHALTLQVKDHGIGIQPKHQKRIFERFYRVPDETVYSRRGTGLGLFVVASLARSLGWKLQAHSAGLGCGTTVSLHIPHQSRGELR